MKTKTRNIQKISEDILKMLVKKEGIKVQIIADKTQILISIHQEFTEKFQSIEEVETEKDFIISPSPAGIEMEKNYSEKEKDEIINKNLTNFDFIDKFINSENKHEPETNDPNRKEILNKFEDEKIKNDFINEHFILCKPTPNQTHEEEKILFDKLSDDLKMIRLTGGKNKDKLRDELLEFVC